VIEQIWFPPLFHATGTAYTLGDIDGLSLNVSAHGGKSWHFRYYWPGEQKRISFGTYPETSLRQALQSRDEARALLAQGANPKVYRKLEIKTGKRSTHTRMMLIFEKDILPFLGKQPIHEIKRLDLLEVVGRVERRGALTVVQNIRIWHACRIYVYSNIVDTKYSLAQKL
jgi:hypothetical protein